MDYESVNEKASGETILIVDDVEPNRLILGEIIKDMGCNPVLAESGEQALELAEEHYPQLVLTDISMPGMTGYELCKVLKGNEKTKNIPVVFISAFDDPHDIVEGFQLGGEDYITKPFIPEVVQARVGVHLRLHVAKWELMEMNRKLQISVGEQLRQMEQEKKNILYAMANVAAQNASYQEEHIERLRRNCRILAQGMQLSPLFEDQISDTFIDTVELAAPLCDIGNIGVPREILQKKSALTEEETSIVQDHTNIGVKLLQDLQIGNDYNDFISTTIDIVKYHHENWDGSGYPDGLRGEEIPLSAQIVSVVERYCILTGEENMDKQEAFAVMEKEAGKGLNRDIFGICCKISRQLI
ncbi:MAG: response regulator [Lachnospiraceae bacterium]|nr:response regulator [Lachnospiraceae bacterium]